jgi:hypothetical protein
MANISSEVKSEIWTKFRLSGEDWQKDLLIREELIF